MPTNLELLPLTVWLELHDAQVVWQIAALAVSLTPDNLKREAAYLDCDGRASFERPYGLAWLLQLGAELREWDSPQAKAWSAALRPLEDSAVLRLQTWLRKLSYPVRSGDWHELRTALEAVTYDGATDPAAWKLPEGGNASAGLALLFFRRRRRDS